MMRRIIGIISVVLALTVLVSCTDKSAMRERLDYVSQCNRADTVFTEAWLPTVDSLVRFFDRHGNANERMMAHYLQGRVHHDMGEAPIALECYQKATEMADTTQKDCDYKTLASIYSQSASLFNQAGLFQNELSAIISASHFYYLAKDTLDYLLCCEWEFAPLYSMGLMDSAEETLLNARKEYLKYGYKEEAAIAISSLIYMYLKDSLRINDAKQLMEIFESESGLFDKNGELPKSRWQYFGLKGRFYESINRLDSAEYYYRKTLRKVSSLSQKVISCKGLMSIYDKRHISDSVFKYANLYCAYNDSTFLNRNTEEMAKITALYNYTHQQHIANQQTVQASKAKTRTWIISGFFVFWIIVSTLLFYFHKRKRQEKMNRLFEDYVKTMEMYESKKEELLFYQKNLEWLMKIKQEAIDKLEEDNLEKTSKYEQLRQETERLKEDFTVFLQEKNVEIKELHDRISILKSQKDLSKLFAKYEDLLALSIIQRFRLCGINTKEKISNDEWGKLKNVVKSGYSDYVSSLENNCVGESQMERAGLLMFLQFRTDEIANILDTSKQRVTNIKCLLNYKLFEDNSARTFYANLRHRYNM